MQLTEEPGLHLVATANAEMVMLATENPTLHTILNNASLGRSRRGWHFVAAERKGRTCARTRNGVDVKNDYLKLRLTSKFLYTA